MNTVPKMQKSITQVFVFLGCLSSFAAHSAPEKSYKDETGRDCVYTVANIPNYPYQNSETYGYYYFENRCLGTFSIRTTLNNGRKVSNGISPRTSKGPGTSHISCKRAAGECGQIYWEAE